MTALSLTADLDAEASVPAAASLDPIDESSSALASRARDLAEADRVLVRNLVQRRFMAGFDVEDVAKLMDVSVASVAAFENGASDPTMSFVRRYAMVLAVAIEHRVVKHP